MTLRHHLRRFIAQDRGNAVIETVIILPTMLVAWIAVYAFWEAYSSRTAFQKAAHVAADLLSREMVPVTDTTLTGLDTVMEYLVDSRFDVASRFASYTRTGPLDTDVVVTWSFSTESATLPALTTADLVARATNLPRLTVGATALVVDTRMNYSLPMSVPVATFVVPSSFSQSVVLRPRFVTRLCRAGTPVVC